jgi:hypothetical protein
VSDPREPRDPSGENEPRSDDTVRSDAAPNVDVATCVLCGSANDCGLARGETTCWCFEVVVPPSLLAQIPEALRDRACVCRACVERASRGLPIV